MTVRQFLRNLQTCGAFIAAFTSEKRLITIKKSFFRHLLLIMKFFVAYFSILVRCKTKGAVRVVCPLLRIWPLSAKWPIAVLDGAESLKGFHFSHDEGRADFSSFFFL
jgi:hypothetical protein